MTGDSRLVSVNPIRDTLFASNPDLYYLIGNVLTIAASLILTVGMAANAAISAGTSVTGSSDRVCQAGTDGGSQQLCGQENDKAQQSTGRLLNRFADWNSNIWNAQ